MQYKISINHIANSLTQTGSNYTYTRKVSKSIPDSKQTGIADAAASLVKKSRILFNGDYSAGASSNILSKIDAFIKSYNDLADKMKDTTNSSAKRNFDKINETIKDNEYALKSIGVTLEKGKLKVDPLKIKDITSESKINNAFRGDKAILSKIMKYAGKIDDVLKNETTIDEVPTYKTVTLDPSNSSKAVSMSGIIGSLDALSRYTYTDKNKASILELIKSFTDKYNEYAKNDSSGVLEADISSHSTTLSSAGIRLSDNKLSIDETILNNSSMDTLNNIFGSNAAFSEAMLKTAKDTFASLIEADANGIVPV